jgi:hypothetical protein
MSNTPGPSDEPSTPRRSTTAATSTEDELKDYLNDLTSSSFYLASPNLFQNVEWFTDGLVDRLDNDLYEEAELRWIGEVSARHFWLYPCGGWKGGKGPTGTWKETPFHKAKATARIMAARHPLFEPLWSSTVAGARKIMASKRTAGMTIKNSLIDDNMIKIRHSLFEVRWLTISFHTFSSLLFPAHFQNCQSNFSRTAARSA